MLIIKRKTFSVLIFFLFFLSSSLVCASDISSLNKKLFKAVTNNDLIVAEELLQKGADPNYKLGHSLLMTLALKSENNSNMMSLLIKYGAIVKYPKGSYTPLHYARHAEVANVLLNAGADVNAKKSDYDIAPLHSILNSYKGSFSLNIGRINADQYIEVIKVLLEAGANPNVVSSRGTPLHIVRITNPKDKIIIEMLINHGADVNSISRREINMKLIGVTPLMSAVYYLDYDKANLLLQHGADIYKGLQNCDAFCALSKVRQNSLNIQKNTVREKALSSLNKMETLLLQYSLDEYAHIKLKIYKLFEFNVKTKFIVSITTIYVIFTIVYVFFLRLFMKIHIGKGILVSMILVPIQLLAASYGASLMTQGIDLSYAGGGVLVFIIAGIFIGMLVGLILVPIILGVFALEKDNKETKESIECKQDENNQLYLSSKEILETKGYTIEPIGNMWIVKKDNSFEYLETLEKLHTYAISREECS